MEVFTAAVLWQFFLWPIQASLTLSSQNHSDISLVTYPVHPDGSSPAVCLTGKNFLDGLAKEPDDAQIFEYVSASPTFDTLITYVSAHQEGIYALVTTLWVLLMVEVSLVIGTVALRRMGRCGGDDNQSVTEAYMVAYTFYVVALSLLLVMFLFLAYCIITTRDTMVLSIEQQAPDMKVEVFANLRAYVKNTAIDLAEMVSRNATATVAEQVRSTLTTNFDASFSRFVLDAIATNWVVPMYSVARECAVDVSHFMPLATENKLLKLTARLEAIGNQCHRIQRRHEDAVIRMAGFLADQTEPQRLSIAEVVANSVTNASDFDLRHDNGERTLKSIDILEKKLVDFEQTYGVYGYLSGTFMTLLLGLRIALLVGVGALFCSIAIGLYIHREGVAPCKRNPPSHATGFLFVFTAYAFAVYISLAIPMVIVLTAYCTLSECYLCAPYRAEQYYVLDDAFRRLWPPEDRSQLFAKLVPSELCTRCTTTFVSILDLGRPESENSTIHNHNLLLLEMLRSPHDKFTMLASSKNNNEQYSEISSVPFDALLDAMHKISVITDARTSTRSVNALYQKWSSFRRNISTESGNNDEVLRTLIVTYYPKFIEHTIRLAQKFFDDTTLVVGPCYIPYSIFLAVMDVVCGTFTTELVGQWYALLSTVILSFLVIPLAFAASKYYFRTKQREKAKSAKPRLPLKTKKATKISQSSSTTTTDTPPSSGTALGHGAAAQHPTAPAPSSVMLRPREIRYLVGIPVVRRAAPRPQSSSLSTDTSSSLSTIETTNPRVVNVRIWPRSKASRSSKGLWKKTTHSTTASLCDHHHHEGPQCHHLTEPLPHLSTHSTVMSAGYTVESAIEIIEEYQLPEPEAHIHTVVPCPHQPPLACHVASNFHVCATSDVYH